MTTTLEELYSFITGEPGDEARACEAISEDACTNVPKNFFLNAANGAVTKLGDQLVNPGVVLPWLIGALGAPEYLVGLLVPVRRAVALLPQLAASAQLRASPIRKWFWAAGAAGFGLMFLLAIPALLLFEDRPAAAGWSLVVILGIASLSRGFSSVAFKDVLGKTIPQGRRGTLLAIRATLGGALALIAGVMLRLYVSDSSSLTPYLLLVGGGGLMWVLGGVFVALMEEEPGATEGGRNALSEVRAGIEVLHGVPGFRHFVLTRIVLMAVTLSIPFYSYYGRSLTGAQASGLGVFVIASSLAEVLSSPVWGRFADRSSRLVMLAAVGIAGLAGAAALLFGVLPPDLQTAAVYAIVIMLLGFSRAGIDLGHKAYLVDGAPRDERPLYAATSNVILGVLTLASGSLGLLLEAIGIRALIGVFIGLALLAVVIVWRMPEAAHMADTASGPAR